jgi:FAD/FMN-containing dehydrogenase
MNPSANYEQKKAQLLSTLSSRSGPLSLTKPTSNLFRPRGDTPSNKIDVSHFNQVLSIDPHTLIAETEAMITYEALVAATLKYNCLPPVVPELKTITIGGALVGLGIESSSFRHGLVHDTILEAEVLTGTGQIVTCTPDNEHSDLFHALPNSYGTLGYVLKLKLKLIPAQPYIQLTNHRFNDPVTFFTQLAHLCQHNTHPYIDGVIFSPTELYIITGTPTSTAPFLNNYTYLHAYYKSIPRLAINYLTTHDYIWRWDSDLFWCSKHYGMNNPLLRLLFGKWLLNSPTCWAISRHPLIKSLTNLFTKKRETIIQDILIPIHNAPAFYSFFSSTIPITPIWICPTRITPSTLIPIPPGLYIDFGFWDYISTTQPPNHYNRLLEHKTLQLHGFKSLYSTSYYTPTEFWQIFPHDIYTQLKSKYDPNSTFRDLYTKCVRT